MQQLTKSRYFHGIIISLVTSLFISALLFSGALDRLEWITYDQRMIYHRSDHPLHEDIKVVMIDEVSLKYMNEVQNIGRWPWPRDVYKGLLEYFQIGGARAVLFDILLPEYQEPNPVGALNNKDQALVDATAQSGNVFHAMQVVRETSERVDTRLKDITPMPEDFVKMHNLEQVKGVPDVGNNSYILPFPELYQAAYGVGIVEFDADSDSVFRHTRILHNYQGHIFPTLGVAPLVAHSDKPISQDDHMIELNGEKIPLTSNGHFLINMAGIYDPYSFSGIINSSIHLYRGDLENAQFLPDEFEDKIILIGASAIGLEDIKTTPISSKHPGVYLHASLLSNLLEKEYLKEMSQELTLVLILIFAFATQIPILFTQRTLLAGLIPMGLAVAYIGWCVWRFSKFEVYHMSGPVLSIALTWLAAFGYLAFTEGKDKRRVRGMLSQYVSPAVLAEVMNRVDDQLQAEIGSREDLSVLFSDVRGFTSISERLEAEKVVELLNTHFSVMSEIIFRYEGTVDKFIGDAIMAFWGAPIKVEDHPERAVKACLEMLDGLIEVNHLLEEKGLPPIHIGIGIHTGDVVLGNIGSARKLDYTVIGDAVNLASRLEGLTKQYQCTAILSEATYNRLNEDIPCAIVDMVRVKGKTHPIRLYTPLSHAGSDPQWHDKAAQIARRCAEAFEFYLEREWDKAIAIYQQLDELPFQKVFLSRCQEYKLNPPPAEWDGVYTMTTK